MGSPSTQRALRRYGLRLCVFLLWAPAAAAQSVDTTIAVAASVSRPMQDLVRSFAAQTGHRVTFVPGATGKLVAQARHGAPFDALLAADIDGPAALMRAGIGVQGSQFTYATGRLVLWSARKGLVDSRGAILRQPLRGRIAVANPRTAPYGRAALETLRSLELEKSIVPALVYAESASQALQYAASGTTPLAFLALSQVQFDGRIAQGSAWLVPAELHRPIRQDFILLQRGRQNAAALAFARFLRSDAARRILLRYGYER